MEIKLSRVVNLELESNLPSTLSKSDIRLMKETILTVVKRVIKNEVSFNQTQDTLRETAITYGSLELLETHRWTIVKIFGHIVNVCKVT
jgi:hypothetical protein